MSIRTPHPHSPSRRLQISTDRKPPITRLISRRDITSRRRTFLVSSIRRRSILRQVPSSSLQITLIAHKAHNMILRTNTLLPFTAILSLIRLQIRAENNTLARHDPPRRFPRHQPRTNTIRRVRAGTGTGPTTSRCSGRGRGLPGPRTGAVLSVLLAVFAAAFFVRHVYQLALVLCGQLRALSVEACVGEFLGCAWFVGC